LESIFDLAALEAEIAELQTKTSSPDLWTDAQAANYALKRLARLRDRVEPFLSLQKTERDIAELRELLDSEPNPEMERELDEMAERFLADIADLELKTLLSGEHDDRGAVVEISAGAGGTEACDWAEILFRMLSRWSQNKGYSLEVLNETPGDVTGYRSASMLISGESAYGYLKSENGVHRLVRISPYDANARRHTSFARIEVLPEIEESEVAVAPEDLKVETLRAGGAGGQHVNKTESAVRITHLPTGITVSCQNERSQHKNRAHAMTVLLARLKELEQAQSEQRARELKGEVPPAEWGRQIRSYVLQPYTMVKDHRTGHETGNAQAVLNGELDEFLEAFLRQKPAKDVFIE